jgi:hypothetical protein
MVITNLWEKAKRARDPEKTHDNQRADLFVWRWHAVATVIVEYSNDSSDFSDDINYDGTDVEDA